MSSPSPASPAPTAKTTILSFDVGIRHLAYCHVAVRGWDVSSIEVLSWDVMDLGPVGSVEHCAQELMGQLQERFGGVKVDVVLIERQPKSRSIIMVAVQMFLCSYFTLAKMDRRVSTAVRFISAQRKLAMGQFSQSQAAQQCNTTQQSQKCRYRDNKAYAISATRHYLEHVLADFGNLVMLDMYKKKDDLCDSFLQALAYVEGRGLCCPVHKQQHFRKKKRFVKCK